MSEANNMSKEAMKLALEALENSGTDMHDIAQYQFEIRAIKALEEALASEQEQRNVSEHLGEPVALKVYRGELCYKSQADDQSFGMWCPVTKDLPFPEGTRLYTTPQQRPSRSDIKPLTDEQLSKLWATHDNWLELCRAIEAAHGIKE